MTRPATVDRAHFDAVIFDLDGVVTSTRDLHADAWKATFDAVLGDDRIGERQRPFDIASDYVRYVDGKPRDAGVESFLRSRGIDLPRGRPGDDVSAMTVCGIGNRKNRLFQKLLADRGANVYPDAVTLIRNLRRQGFALAVVSASRNALAVLRSVRAEDLFHTIIDGRDRDARQLAGKPAPDVFLAAAQILDVVPSRAVVIEDAVAGVRAGRAGKFGLVIGVNRGEWGEALVGAGADVVVDDLDELAVGSAISVPEDALDCVQEIVARSDARPLAVFLDYDGTLTPIVDRPEDAALDGAARKTLQRLARAHTTAVISGRDLDDVRRRVDVDDVIYAGNHGFEILLPNGSRRVVEGVESLVSGIRQAESRLRERLRRIDGAIVEGKRFAVAAHYRLVAPETVSEFEAIVDEIVSGTDGISVRRGKCVVELLPDIHWDKGAAVRWILENLSGPPPMAIFLGDDVTDEDAFHAVRLAGVGIVVMDAPRATAARYCLRDTAAVMALLDRLSGAAH